MRLPLETQSVVIYRLSPHLVVKKRRMNITYMAVERKREERKEGALQVLWPEKHEKHGRSIAVADQAALLGTNPSFDSNLSSKLFVSYKDESPCDSDKGGV